jgi:hypothetical protein
MTTGTHNEDPNDKIKAFIVFILLILTIFLANKLLHVG